MFVTMTVRFARIHTFLHEIFKYMYRVRRNLSGVKIGFFVMEFNNRDAFNGRLFPGDK